MTAFFYVVLSKNIFSESSTFFCSLEWIWFGSTV